MELVKSPLNAFFPTKKTSEQLVSVAQDAGTLVRSRTDIPPNRKVEVAWTVPARLFTPRTKDYYRRLVSLIFVIGVVLILGGQFLLLALVVSLAVLYYVLSSVEPQTVRHEIDNYGVHCFGKQYYWADFKFFFVTKEGHFDAVHLDTVDALPGRITLLVADDNSQKVIDHLSQNLTRRLDAPSTVFDKTFRRLSSKLSLD